MALTPQEFANGMHQIVHDYADDPEGIHDAADDLMAEVLEELGYSEGIKVYNNIDKECY